MKRHPFAAALLALLATGPLVLAETPGLKLSSPVLGYVFDSNAHLIRAISGVPGPASLGEPVLLSGTLASANVHSGAQLAIAITKEGEIALASWGTSAGLEAEPTELTKLTASAFSRSGSRLAITDGETVEVWSHHPLALVSRQRFDLGVAALAVNDVGLLAVATSNGLVVLGEQDRIIASGEAWTALAFSTGGDVLAAGSELLRISPDGGRTILASLAERASGIAEAADGSAVVVGLASGFLVVSGNGSAQIGCDCHPAQFQPLAGNLAVYVGGTNFVFDNDGAGPRLTSLPNLALAAANPVGANQ